MHSSSLRGDRQVGAAVMHCLARGDRQVDAAVMHCLASHGLWTAASRVFTFPVQFETADNNNNVVVIAKHHNFEKFGKRLTKNKRK